RWFRLGALSFQPSELSKLFIVGYLAFFLEKRLGQIDDWRSTLLPCLVVVLPFVMLIVAEPDLGTSVCLSVVAFMALVMAGLRYRFSIGALLSAVPVLFLLVYFFPYRLKRVLVFIDPWKDPLGAGFQITQSLIALGSGGLFGLGLMEGKQKLFY